MPSENGKRPPENQEYIVTYSNDEAEYYEKDEVTKCALF
ncbi:hypothetical protein RU95_GL003235 [Enterococcus avium]|nr:hypothetical protein RU95_GL003235 [Enterococcus avium]